MTRLERYAKAKADRLAGKYNGAPFYHYFPRLGKILPTIPRGKQIMVLGGSGSGKSHMWVGFYLITIYKLIKFKGYKAKMFIALLEDPIEMFEDRIFCAMMFLKFNIRIDPLDLGSMKEKVLDDSIVEKFAEVDRIVDEILSHCVIIDNIYNVTGIYKWLRTESSEMGEHVYEDRVFSYNNDDGSTYTKTVKVYKEYIPNDPDLHCFMFFDNLNNVSEETDSESKRKLNQAECMTKWCRDYARMQIVKHWDWTVINVMQTAIEFDNKQFDFKGNSIVEKLEPSIAALGDNKRISRDHHLIMGIFVPARFGIKDYEKYRIDKLGDLFRSVVIVKSNICTPNIKIPLYFDGSCSYYREMPFSNDMTESIYDDMRNFRWIKKHK